MTHRPIASVLSPDELARRIAAGESYTDIARDLGYAPCTVQHYGARIIPVEVRAAMRSRNSARNGADNAEKAREKYAAAAAWLVEHDDGTQPATVLIEQAAAEGLALSQNFVRSQRRKRGVVLDKSAILRAANQRQREAYRQRRLCPRCEISDEFPQCPLLPDDLCLYCHLELAGFSAARVMRGLVCEHGDNGNYIVSDDFSIVYGMGDTPRSALFDYAMMLGEYVKLRRMNDGAE